MSVQHANQKHINNLPLARPLARQFAQMFGGKTHHVWHPIRTCFFVFQLENTNNYFLFQTSKLISIYVYRLHC